MFNDFDCSASFELMNPFLTPKSPRSTNRCHRCQPRRRPLSLAEISAWSLAKSGELPLQSAASLTAESMSVFSS
jgi:hypothetical protein